MTKSMKQIKERTFYVDACDLKKAWLNSTKQITCQYKLDGLTWTGDIQKIYLDKDGEAVGYDVYDY